MKKYLRSFIDIRKGEVGVTLLLLANIYLLLVTYYFLKPARDSLFLAKLGPGQLPIVFIVIALAIVPITTLYSRASRALRLNQLINATLVLVIVSLFVLRWLMNMSYFWVPYVFYAWVSVYGVLTTSQFWLMANAVYDATQAKRLFALLGLGAIFGAWTGGEVTNIVVTSFGVSTENLLYFCVALIAVSIAITNSVWVLQGRRVEEQSGARRKRSDPRESFIQMFSSIRRSRHLLLIVGIIAITMMVASLVDFQFKAVSTLSFQDAATGEVDKAGLTAFMGKFYGRLSLVSIFLQLIFAYRFLRVLGVGGVILFLPLGLLVGSAAMFLSVSLVAAVLLRGADGSLKYSIDKTGRELLFLPVPLDLKKRTKVFIDMFVDRWARGVAGGLLLLLLVLFKYDTDPSQAIRLMSLVVVGFLAIWMVLALLMRREYVDTFRQAVQKREIDLSEVRIRINESATIRTLVDSLKSPNEREVDYAVSMLTSVKNADLIEPLRSLLKHSSAEIRKKSLAVLMAQEDASLVDDAKRMLDDEDVEVRRQAMRFIFQTAGPDREQTVSGFLGHPDPRYRCAAVVTLAEFGSAEDQSRLTEEVIESLLNAPGDQAPLARQQIARALGFMDSKRFGKYFKGLLDDPSGPVVSEMIASIGRLGEREYVPWLMKALADRRYRPRVRRAVAAFGTSILGTLHDYLIDEKVELSVRRNIPRVIGLIPEQESVEILTRSISIVDPALKYHVVKALNRLRSGYPHLKFDEQRVDQALIEETRCYYEIAQLLDLQPSADTDGSQLLSRALSERQEQNLERIFRLLGLHYPPSDIYSAYLRIVSRKQVYRASAIEFLDNLVKGDVKKYLFPILDEASPERVVRKGRELFGIRFEHKDQALLYLMGGRDSWLKACAVYNALDCESPEVIEAVESARSDRDPVVRQTAEFVIGRIRS
ncbi:MAG: hypothetical protein JSW34_12140 [Candidatus Zixiibacteriota bacterium]|nr:MAG: hypothetical protein JSW34_12140 [candidate division Zixibacteria bacterium]